MGPTCTVHPPSPKANRGGWVGFDRCVCVCVCMYVHQSLSSLCFSQHSGSSDLITTVPTSPPAASDWVTSGVTSVASWFTLSAPVWLGPDRTGITWTAACSAPVLPPPPATASLLLMMLLTMRGATTATVGLAVVMVTTGVPPACDTTS